MNLFKYFSIILVFSCLGISEESEGEETREIVSVTYIYDEYGGVTGRYTWLRTEQRCVGSSMGNCIVEIKYEDEGVTTGDGKNYVKSTQNGYEIGIHIGDISFIHSTGSDLNNSSAGFNFSDGYRIRIHNCPAYPALNGFTFDLQGQIPDNNEFVYFFVPTI